MTYYFYTVVLQVFEFLDSYNHPIARGRLLQIAQILHAEFGKSCMCSTPGGELFWWKFTKSSKAGT